MSQHDMNIANQLQAAFRSDLNDALGALVTNSSGTAAPGTTFANQFWVDTTNSLAKKRNNANGAWQTFASMDFDVWLLGDGAVGAPAYSFSADTDCGMYRIGANNIGWAVGATKYMDLAPGVLTLTAAQLAITNASAAPITLVFDGAISQGVASKTSSATNGSAHIAFRWSDNSTIGSITNPNSTSTAFNTSSDADLKDDLGVCTDVSVLKHTVVRDYAWKDNGIVDRGVFAQQAQAWKPNAVTVGSDEIDPANGKKVRPWMVDYSKYVPDLIVGWQNHEARLVALEASLA